jgi:hypothetical protein
MVKVVFVVWARRSFLADGFGFNTLTWQVHPAVALFEVLALLRQLQQTLPLRTP